MSQTTKTTTRLRAFINRKWVLALGAGLVVIAVVAALASLPNRQDDKASAMLPTFTAVKGSLVIDALEPGNVEASEAQVVRCEVEGRSTIINLIPEGTIITPKDVEDKKVLVELDSAELTDRESQQEITVEGALSNYAEAKASYEIQRNQNESDLRTAELNVKFGKIDLQRYLGTDLADRFTSDQIALADLIKDPTIGGETLQKKRGLESDIDLAQEDLARAQVRLEWTRQLEAKGYATRDDLRADELALKRSQVSVERSKVALDQYTRYDFAKDAEKLKSDLAKAISELLRTVAKNESEIVKAESRLRTTEITLKRQQEQLAKLKEQIAHCMIVATKPGLVVWGGAGRHDPDEQIKEGISVRERQEILSIPNTTSMTVRTRVHESVVARVHEGLPAFITIDAIPDTVFKGVITKVGLLPDSSDRWMNPNLKVYVTYASIDCEYGILKPGMTAQVRIILDELKDVVMVPLQAITVKDDRRVCMVVTPTGRETRPVEVGDYNDKFIAIKNGLQPGDTVVLQKSIFIGSETSGEGAKKSKRGGGGSKAKQQGAQEPAAEGQGAAEEANKPAAANQDSGMGQAPDAGGAQKQVGGQAKPNGAKADEVSIPPPASLTGVRRSGNRSLSDRSVESDLSNKGAVSGVEKKSKKAGEKPVRSQGSSEGKPPIPGFMRGRP